MQCLYPVKLKRIYHDKEGKYVYGKSVGFYTQHGKRFRDSIEDFEVPCGRCIACRINYATMWSLRLMQELKHHDKAVFLTLTYDDANVPANGQLCKRDLQLFFKKIRKAGYKIRYFACGEYGDQFDRPHYHAIIFGMSFFDRQVLADIWKFGFIKADEVNENTTAYCAKYMTKKVKGDAAKVLKEEGFQDCFVLMSRRPGIGSKISVDYADFLCNNGFAIRQGAKVAVPRYYKDSLGIDCSGYDGFSLRGDNGNSIQRERNIKAKLGLKDQKKFAMKAGV